MNKIITLSLMILLVGCHGEGALDASSYSMGNKKNSNQSTGTSDLDTTARVDGGGDGDLGGGPSDVTKLDPNHDVTARTGGGGDGDLGGGPSDITKVNTRTDYGTNKIPTNNYNPQGVSCKNGLGSDYWTLMGVGGRTDYQVRVDKIVRLSDSQKECYLTSRIKKRRVMNLTNKVFNELLENELPIRPSNPSLTHLDNKRIFPLFTASFYESCAIALNEMEKVGFERITSPSNEEDFQKIKNSLKASSEAIYHGESQFIDCSYTLRDNPTKKYRVIDLLKMYQTASKEAGIKISDSKKMKCAEMVQIKSCNEINPSAECNSPIQVPLEGEEYVSTHDRYHSWLKRYVFEAIEYSTQSTSCVLDGSSQLGKLALGDMGTPNGRDVPGHPLYTHHENRSVDIAYYQKNTPNNHLRPVCEYKINGVDKEHCVEEPHLIDYQRTAVFVTKLLESPRLSFIGIDARISEGLERAILSMCREEGLLYGSKGCARLDLIRSTKSTDSQLYKHHHHHMHVNFR